MPRRYALSDSESESDQPLSSARSGPSEDAMEKALRDTVARIYHEGNMEDLTVKRVRAAAEKSLGLDEGFFKADASWKGRSDGIIKDEVGVQDRAVQRQGGHGDEEQAEEPSPPKPEPAKGKPAKPTKATKRANAGDASEEPSPPKPEPAKGKSAKPANANKRSNAGDVSMARKKRKTSSPVPEESAGSESEEVQKPPKRSRVSNKKEQRQPSEDRVSEDSDFDEEVKEPAKRSKRKPEKHEPNLSNDRVSDDSDAPKEEPKPSEEGNDKDGSESELSVVIDQEPPKPSRKRQKSSEPPSGKPKKGGKAKDADLDPDQAEIKRLQGWLVKCGIRKIWARELAPYDTPKAKIKHLKGMLKDAGMEGRYSLEKAKRIKEERELKEDLEMVQEGAKRWGTAEAEEGSEQERPRRRLAQGRRSLAFLDGIGEESD
ncbi:hypothetical protein PHISP_03516 [Aspergillus sp. HF37]|nr:hypothetical protein PHISP_03516 [Aspergillus sp. HF37]